MSSAAPPSPRQKAAEMIHHAFTSGCFGCVCNCGAQTDNAHVCGPPAALVISCRQCCEVCSPSAPVERIGPVTGLSGVQEGLF